MATQCCGKTFHSRRALTLHEQRGAQHKKSEMTTNPPEPQKSAGNFAGRTDRISSTDFGSHRRSSLTKPQKIELRDTNVPDMPQPQKAGEQDTPMGASAWEAHGKKYGYWDFFEKKQNERYMTLERRVTELEEEVWRIDE